MLSTIPRHVRTPFIIRTNMRGRLQTQNAKQGKRCSLELWHENESGCILSRRSISRVRAIRIAVTARANTNGKHERSDGRWKPSSTLLFSLDLIADRVSMAQLSFVVFRWRCGNLVQHAMAMPGHHHSARQRVAVTGENRTTESVALAKTPLADADADVDRRFETF